MPNLRLALRTLFKAPFVTVVAIVSLSLGIGANSAIFSLFNQMLLRPLPVANPEELVNLGAPGPKPGSNSCSNAGGCDAARVTGRSHECSQMRMIAKSPNRQISRLPIK